MEEYIMNELTLVILEGIVMCFALLMVCVVATANGVVGGVIFFEEDVQKRVVELGYTTEEQLKKRGAKLYAALFLLLATFVPYMVYGINGAVGFWNGFWQMTIILWIMGLFDRLFIDEYWVGRTKAWDIEGTEDLKPYIPAKVKARKWTVTMIGYPVIAALVAWIVAIFQ